jgi:hypothetical protein
MSQATDILNHIKTHGAINPLMALETIRLYEVGSENLRT